MTTHLSQRIKYPLAERATSAGYERFNRIEHTAVDVVVVTAELLARTASAQRAGDTRGQVNEIQCIGVRLRHRAVLNESLQSLLDLSVADRAASSAGFRSGDRRGA